MKYFKIILFNLMLIVFAQNNLSAQLFYAEGGPATEDPGLEVTPNLRRYVDAVSGNDANDGKTPATAWKTQGKVVSERGSFPKGTHIFFKRGQSWSGNFGFTNVHGTEGNRIVLGAYGLPLTSKAKIKGTIDLSSCSYIMLRDFDCVKVSLTAAFGDIGPHHIIVYDNVVHGQAGVFPSNGIRVWALAHHIAVVGNLVYDLGANDCITIHGDADKVGPGSGHWVLDNTVIGNSGMEDGIDVAMSDYSKYGYTQEGDIKIVANRIQVNAVVGLSIKTGRGQKCINSGHDGRYFWYVGNIMTGSSHIGFNLGGKDKKNTFISGNVAYRNALSAEKVSFDFTQPNCFIDHNTIMHTVSYRAPIKVLGTGSYLLSNLLMRSQSGNYVEGAPLMQGNITTLSVPGMSIPENSAFNNDPRNWTDPNFLNHFIPDASWSANQGSSTPGAFDSDKNWLGLEIKAFSNSNLENNGLGWEGPPLVQHRLKELGIIFGDVVAIEESKNEVLPNLFAIGNYPNPFNPTTTIKYDLPKAGDVKIQIYDIMGSLVEELVNGKQNAGSHSVIWHGRNSHGIQTSSGIYLYKVQYNDQIKTAKMIFMK